MNKELDWPRIAHLMKIGIAAALMVLAGDMLLGWEMHDATKIFVFWLVHQIAHFAAFSKGLTPCPKWCWIFCPAVGMALTMLLKLFPETPLRNALTAGWISIGNLWMFGGLLATMKKAKENPA